MKKLREVAHEIGLEIGCQDNSCVWGAPPVGTNGGCRCIDKEDNPRLLRRQARQMAYLARHLLIQLDDKS